MYLRAMQPRSSGGTRTDRDELPDVWIGAGNGSRTSTAPQSEPATDCEAVRWHLVVRGLYRWVRNPMYVGMGTFLIGEALALPAIRRDVRDDRRGVGARHRVYPALRGADAATAVWRGLRRVVPQRAQMDSAPDAV